jgi:hypothetical protein
MGWKKLYSYNKSHIVLETHMKIPDMNNRLNFCMKYSENMLAFFTDRFLRGYEDEEGYIHIYSGMLKKVFGNQYKVPLDELVDRGFIYYKWWENAEGKLVRYDPETSECSKIK